MSGQTADEIVVTQEDRLAAGLYAPSLRDMQPIFDGEADGLPVVQAFARHRIASIAAARPIIEREEREKCAKLADEYAAKWDDWEEGIAAQDVAAAIRSGSVER